MERENAALSITIAQRHDTRSAAVDRIAYAHIGMKMQTVTSDGKNCLSPDINQRTQQFIPCLDDIGRDVCIIRTLP